jgi:hypothetical protein
VAVELLSLLTMDTEVRLHFRLGTIPGTYVSGRPTVIFDGEGAASSRVYPYLSSYAPAAGDRVLVAMVGHGGVVLGKPV